MNIGHALVSLSPTALVQLCLVLRHLRQFRLEGFNRGGINKALRQSIVHEYVSVQRPRVQSMLVIHSIDLWIQCLGMIIGLQTLGEWQGCAQKGVTMT